MDVGVDVAVDVVVDVTVSIAVDVTEGESRHRSIEFALIL